MTMRREVNLIGVVICLVFAAITVPYFFAWQSAGDAYQFTGFLLNPQDGNSYLAKMFLGWRGDFLFTLPYTAERGSGTYLFLFYIYLGHIARLLDISLVTMFHLARGLSALIMFLSLYRFLFHTFTQVYVRVFAFVLTALGSGMGWLALVFGGFTSDFWVAEAYPFLSAYSNPHFPLALAIVLVLLTFTRDQKSELNAWLTVSLSLFLAIILPFGVVLVLLVLAGLVLWEFFPRDAGVLRSVVFRRWVWIGLGGIPVLIYDFVVTLQDPLLKIWNIQNLTPSPQWWDLVISISPLIFFALVGIFKGYRSQDRSVRLLITWVVLGIILLYVPWGLQRRFMLGLFVPVCALAAAGLGAFAKNRRGYIVGAIIITLLVMPTNLIILMSSTQAISTHNSQIYLSKSEAEALNWIASQTPADAIILAAPETGLFIPAYTGRRVFYGHPYETVDALLEKARVTRFFQGVSTRVGKDDLLTKADYVFFGPRERLIGPDLPMQDLKSVFATPSVLIYQVTDH